MTPSIFNPFAYLRFMRRLYRRLNGPAPLNDYPDYDEYWERRHTSGKNPGLLHRYRAIARILPPGASVLDVGCGDGSFGMHLRDTRPDCKYFGVDISKAAIAMLHGRGLAGSTIDPSLRLREQVHDAYDVVTAMEVIEHVLDAEDLMEDFVSLAKTEVIVTIPNSGFILHRVRLAVFGRFPVTTIVFHMKEHIRFWTYRDFKQWVALFDLSIKELIGQESSTSGFERFFMRRFPAIFAPQVIYRLEKQPAREGMQC